MPTTVPATDSSIHYGASAWEAAQTIVGVEGIRCATRAGSLNFTAPFVEAQVIAFYLYENISPGPKPQVTCLLDGKPQPNSNFPPPISLHDVAKQWVVCDVTPPTSAAPQNHTLEVRVDSATPTSPFCFESFALEILQPNMNMQGSGDGNTTQGSSTSLTKSDSSSSHSTTIVSNSATHSTAADSYSTTIATDSTASVASSTTDANAPASWTTLADTQSGAATQGQTPVGAIVGGTLGGIALILLICGGLFFWMKRRREHRYTRTSNVDEDARNRGPSNTMTLMGMSLPLPFRSRPKPRPRSTMTRAEFLEARGGPVSILRRSPLDGDTMSVDDLTIFQVPPTDGDSEVHPWPSRSSEDSDLSEKKYGYSDSMEGPILVQLPKAEQASPVDSAPSKPPRLQSPPPNPSKLS